MRMIYKGFPYAAVMCIPNSENMFYFDIISNSVVQKDHTKNNAVYPKLFDGTFSSFMYMNEEARNKLKEYGLTQLHCAYKEEHNYGLQKITAMWYGFKY